MVHSFSQNGYNLALDSESGAVHILSDLAYEILQLFTEKLPQSAEEIPNIKDYSRQQITEAFDDLKALEDNGTLFSAPAITEALKYTPGVSAIKSMCLHISHDCNMRCKYCFADGGDYKRARGLMSYECGCRAIDFLLERSKGIKNLELDFFGGEPLMNFDVVKKLVAYGREKEKLYGKNIRFTITTNGVLLDDDAIDFINKNIYNAVLSIDGRREVNDYMRPLAGGQGTYDIILPKYKKLVKDRTMDWYVRGTYTRRNLDFVNDVLTLADEGFQNISVEPVVLPDESEFALRREDLPVLFEQYELLAKEMLKREKEGRGFTFVHFMIDRDAGPCVYKRTKGCGCGSEYVAVTPKGDIYPCHQFVEHTELKLGNIFDDTFDGTIATQFAENNIINNEKCKNCWARYFCGGGCSANNYNFHHDIREPYSIACELEKKRVECAIMIKAAQACEEE